MLAMLATITEHDLIMVVLVLAIVALALFLVRR